MGEGVVPASCLVTGDDNGRGGVSGRNALDPTSFPEHENPNFDTASVKLRRLLPPDNPRRLARHSFETEEPPVSKLIFDYSEQPDNLLPGASNRPQIALKSPSNRPQIALKSP